MISYSDALKQISDRARAAKTLREEEVGLQESVGRVLSQDLCGFESIPSFDNSAMDGFAVNSRCLAEASVANQVALPVVACVAAGDAASFPEQQYHRQYQGAAIEIMTGAPMPPPPFDSVVKVEDVEVKRDLNGVALEIRLRAPVPASANVRYRGEDFQAGDRLLSKGTRLLPSHLLALAAFGIDPLPVFKRPKVALVSTGRELVPHCEKKLKPGLIRNSTAPFLIAELQRFGAEPHFYGTVPDETRPFEELLRRILDDRPDVILTTGAVSMGKFDFVGESVAKMGGTQLFHKVAIRPGKPLLFAQWENGAPVLFGIPGNPVSTAVAFRFFVQPYLRTLCRMPREDSHRACLKDAVPKPLGLRAFYKAFVQISSEGRSQVEVLPGQASFRIGPLLKANVWAVLPEEDSELPAGTSVEVFSL